MGWFSKKSAPPSVRPPAWLGEADVGGGFARSYEAQVKEVYRTNPVGFRAVRMVGQALGGLTVYAEQGPDEVARLIGGALLERAGAAMLLHGNAYVQLLADGDDRPAELAAEHVQVALRRPAGVLRRGGGRSAGTALGGGHSVLVHWLGTFLPCWDYRLR